MHADPCVEFEMQISIGFRISYIIILIKLYNRQFLGGIQFDRNSIGVSTSLILKSLRGVVFYSSFLSFFQVGTAIPSIGF